MTTPRETNPPLRAATHSPVTEMLMIAAPSVVTMTSYTVMQFCDGLMVSQITPADPVYVSAQGNGGMAVWLALSGVMGALGVVNTFVSQNLGAGRPERGAAYGWSVLWIALAWSFVLVPYGLLLPALFRLMGHPAHLVQLETQYAQINVMGAFFILAARGIAHYFYGLHRPSVVMISALLANVVNVSLNAILIYGPDGPPSWTPLHEQIAALSAWLGVPAMGVAGAAYATITGAAVELIIPIAMFVSPRMNARFRTRAAWRPSAPHIRDIVRVGWPAGVMFVNEMICWGFLMAFMLPAGGAAKARLLDLPPEQLEAAVEQAKTTANTAGWIALRYMHLSFMPAVGMSIAVTAMVGKCMGMRRPDLAAKRAWLGMVMTVGYMGCCALGFVLFRESLVRLFIPRELDAAHSLELLHVATTVMVAAAIFQVFDAVAITTSAALRGAGDTVWPGVVTVVASWTCIVVVGLGLLRLAPQLGSIGPWIGASSYIIVLGIAFLSRFMAGRWRSIDLLGSAAGDAAAGAAGPPNEAFPAPTEALAGGLPGEA
ncbi:MAG: MATE family efflux transporter [Phycisphaerales bacterium]|nr:MATE family efflux transporter [Phycisphaerales bacterium]